MLDSQRSSIRKKLAPSNSVTRKNALEPLLRKEVLHYWFDFHALEEYYDASVYLCVSRDSPASYDYDEIMLEIMIE